MKTPLRMTAMLGKLMCFLFGHAVDDTDLYCLTCGEQKFKRMKTPLRMIELLALGMTAVVAVGMGVAVLALLFWRGAL